MSAWCKLSNLSLLAILMLSMCLFRVNASIAQIDPVSSKLQAANDAINQAFNYVLDAEKAGANVTNLLTQINTAEEMLAKAENSYRSGDTNTALVQADNALPIAQQVITAAQNAKQDAIISRQNNFWFTIAFTVVGTIMFLEILFLFWLWFKRRYVKNLSEARHELVNP